MIIIHAISQQIRKLSFVIQSKTVARAIKNLLISEQIVLLDVGATGGVEPRWKRISPMLHYIGFEPDTRGDSMKKQVMFAEYSEFSFALGEHETKQKLYICKAVGKSSIYKPNYLFLRNFSDITRFQIENEIEIESKNIDKVVPKKIDFIKLDTQGSELDILIGGKNTLVSVFGVEIEVEFHELYLNQPLFNSVSEFLSKHGFEFIDFINLSRWERNTYSGLGQLVFADALFLKTPEKIYKDNLSKVDLKKYLSILFLYNRFDLIEKCFFLYPNLKIEFKHFYKTQNRKRRKQQRINYLNRVFSAVLSIFGIEIRTHVLY